MVRIHLLQPIYCRVSVVGRTGVTVNHIPTLVNIGGPNPPPTTNLRGSGISRRADFESVAKDDNERVPKLASHGFTLVGNEGSSFWFLSNCSSLAVVVRVHPSHTFSQWLDTQVNGPGPW